MLLITLLTIIIATTTITFADNYFRVNHREFEQLVDGEWKVFGKFAGVNLGVTSPGHLPGEVILRKEDYIRRFERLHALNVKVIRVYSLLHPEFYETLNEWNQNHEPLYVLHGTAFPEEKFYDGEEGSDLYQRDIFHEMKNYIDRTVQGVFGKGSVVYRHEKGDYSKPIKATYTTDISKYLLGFVIGGEISPHTVYKTNNFVEMNERQTMTPEYKGLYFETNSSQWFEAWVAEMLDFTAWKCSQYGVMVPVSQTNWVTLDGIKNPIESRFFTSTNYTSEEDWQELDSTLIHPINGASMFYNEHIYPYYPEFLTYHANGIDGYYDYLQRLKQKYSDKPFVITEIGISTSIGQASSEEYGRNHGGVTQHDQGTMMQKLMMDIIYQFDYYGVVVFQLHDEWFKRSWNTQYFDADGPSRSKVTEARRHMWHNVMSAEEGFGIYEVVPKDNLNEKKVSYKNYDLKISHHEMYLTIEITFDENAEIMIGIDNKPDGSTKIFSFGTDFNNPIDSFLKISKTEHSYYQSSGHDLFLRQYGWWLHFIQLELGQTCPNMKNLEEEFPILKQRTVYHVNDFFNYSFNFFNEFRQIVKLPSILYPSRTIDNINDISNPLCLAYTTKTLDIDRLVSARFYNGTITKIINLPYHVLGYGDPTNNEVIVMKNQGSRIEYIPHKNDKPINFEISYSMNGQELTRTEESYDLTGWNIPRCFCEKAKESFPYFQEAFKRINNRNNNITNTYDACVCIKEPFDLNKYVLQTAIFVLFLATFVASVGNILLFMKNGFNFKEYRHSVKLIVLNLMASVGLMYLFLTFVPTSAHFTLSYLLYILLIVWDSLILIIVMSVTKWNLHAENNRTFNESEHVFIIACHNSSNVLTDTLRILLTKVKPRQIYVADNGSTKKEVEITKYICEEESLIYHMNHDDSGGFVNYGCMKLGNKTIAQYGTLCNLPPNVKYATCIDDDTRLDDSWNVHKVIKYFEDDEEIAVLAYPLSVWNPTSDLEWFQAMEYLIVGYIKIFHSKIYSTIFNSGAFGTYRVDILKEALLYHNTDHHGDDLQICMNIHQLKGKKFYNDSSKKHILDYKVATATDMIVSTIAPKCWFHLSAISKCFKQCHCENPDLFSQRCKGWFVSQHRFIPRYIKLIFNVKGINGSLWVRFVALYELITILNEYFAIVYIFLFLKNIGMWLVEGLLIGYACNIIVMTIFNQRVLKKNKLYIPYEVITLQLVLYKFFMIVIYRYAGLFYNLFIYTLKHRSGTPIIHRLKDAKFREILAQMFESKELNQIVDQDDDISVRISNEDIGEVSDPESIPSVHKVHQNELSNPLYLSNVEV